MALVNVIRIESYQSSRCHTSTRQSTFQFTVATTAVSVRLQRCYDYTLSRGAEEVASHSRRSIDFAFCQWIHKTNEIILLLDTWCFMQRERTRYGTVSDNYYIWPWTVFCVLSVFVDPCVTTFCLRCRL